MGNNILGESSELGHPWSYGVVSLSEMLHRFRASTLMTCTWNLQKAGVGFVDGLATEDDCRKRVEDGLSGLHKECKHAGLESICTHIEVIQRSMKVNVGSFPNVISQVMTLLGVLQASLVKQIFFRFDEESANLYMDFGLTTGAVDSFPSSWRELGHSSRCLAFDQSTASVFHSMRAIEFPLHSLANALAITPSNPNWENIINDCEKAIKAISPQSGTSWKDEKQFYSEAAVNFRYFKDAWRNHAMHAKVSYERRDAKEILEHSRSLIEHLSSRLKEGEADGK